MDADMDADILRLLEMHDEGTNVTVKVARVALGYAQDHAAEAARLLKIEINTATA
ncbi:hypothetical protein ONA92_17235 [Mycobacteroides salmoniphilum]|uniref:hypothetical protein n=1 Tax=Mycobacteroides salmoniphilum TaxID=404941 RepID=UPI0035679D82